MDERRSADALYGFLYSIVFLSMSKERKTRALYPSLQSPFLLLINRSIAQPLLCRLKGTPSLRAFLPDSSSILLEQKTANKIVRLLIHQHGLKDRGTQQFAFKGCDNLKRMLRIRSVQTIFVSSRKDHLLQSLIRLMKNVLTLSFCFTCL